MNRQAFLDELTELSRKHGIVIGGCGCCGSPWLDVMEPGRSGKYACARLDETLYWSGDKDE